MRTSELAMRAGVNVQTLRYYERRGLLAAPPRSGSGYRAYPSDAVRVVRFVKRAQQLGFTLEEIEELLHLAGGGPDSCEAARGVAEARLADLDAKIADLRRMRDSLDRLVATCPRPRVERECPLLQAIRVDSEEDSQ
jgi:MerR family transcriptional regulator, mercuric resistance operon regulatory protein